MENQTAPATSKPCLPISKLGFENSCRYLSVDRVITARGMLLPVHSCQAVIDVLTIEAPPIGEDRGKLAISVMLTAYPNAMLKFRSDGEAVDLKAYARRMAKVMALYGEADCAAVVRPGTGLPSRLAFLPTEAELTAALVAEVSRRGLIVANARAHIREAARRAAEQEEDARIEAERRSMTPEQRKARADAIVARLNTIHEITGATKSPAW